MSLPLALCVGVFDAVPVGVPVEDGVTDEEADIVVVGVGVGVAVTVDEAELDFEADADAESERVPSNEIAAALVVTVIVDVAKKSVDAVASSELDAIRVTDTLPEAERVKACVFEEDVEPDGDFDAACVVEEDGEPEPDLVKAGDTVTCTELDTDRVAVTKLVADIVDDVHPDDDGDADIDSDGAPDRDADAHLEADRDCTADPVNSAEADAEAVAIGDKVGEVDTENDADVLGLHVCVIDGLADGFAEAAGMATP